MPTLSMREAKRLALVCAGLLKPQLLGLPDRAAGSGRRVRARCHRIIERFGYLQLDSVAISGARTHGIVLASRLKNFDTQIAECLLMPGEPLFEYWGHEACWLPMSLYPCLRFRREAYAEDHPWWGPVIAENQDLANAVTQRITDEGPVRSLDLEGTKEFAGWGAKRATRVLEALWSAGILAVRFRQRFQRSFDLTERVIPQDVRTDIMSIESCYDQLILKALDGHGWATTGTIAATWRLRNCRDAIHASLQRLVETGQIVACDLHAPQRRIAGWCRPESLELVHRLDGIRPRKSIGVLLSPFDPILWDRVRCALLFNFEQRLEIYKPVQQRQYGYYCLPVLAGDGLVARVDLRAERKNGVLHVLSCHYEAGGGTAARAAVQSAVERFAQSVGLSASFSNTDVR